MAFDQYDKEMMALAIREAEKARELWETPVGAVLCWEGIEEPVAFGHNLRETGRSALAHAEINAIAEGCRALNGWRLHKATLYVTLEPCPMCAGAIINARIKRVVYGAPDKKAGCCHSVANLFALPFNHKPIVEGGLMEEECANLLTNFFLQLREKKKGLL